MHSRGKCLSRIFGNRDDWGNCLSLGGLWAALGRLPTPKSVVSILVTHLVPQGLIFAADRNITTSISAPPVVRVGQKQRPKVLKWPNADVIVVYVGAGAIGGVATDTWLYDFIGRNLQFADLDHLADNLTDDLNHALASGELDADDSLILHLGGFEEVDSEWTPRIWHIHDTDGLEDDGSYVPGSTFIRSEEIAQPYYFGTDSGSQIHAKVAASVASGGLFSFRQGFDLLSFNPIDKALRGAMFEITRTHPSKPHPIPSTLEDWEKHVRLAVLGYGAYFAAFYEPFEQYVGGGVDVVSVPWPGQ